MINRIKRKLYAEEMVWCDVLWSVTSNTYISRWAAAYFGISCLIGPSKSYIRIVSDVITQVGYSGGGNSLWSLLLPLIKVYFRQIHANLLLHLFGVFCHIRTSFAELVVYFSL